MGDGGNGRGTRLALIAASAVAAAALVAGALVVLGGDDAGDGGPSRPSSEEQAVIDALERFTTAVSSGDPGAGGTVEPADQVAAEYVEALKALPGVDLDVVAGPPVLAGSTATAPLRTTWDVGGATWTSEGTARLVATDGAWRVRWELASLDRRLGPGVALSATRVAPTRGTILGAGGDVLAAGEATVTIGVRPARVTDLPALVAELDRLLDIDPADVTARVQAAAPDAFVEVATLPRAEYDPIRDEVRPLPGTVFRETGDAADDGFAAALLGEVGPATEEQVAASEGRLEVGQTAGQSGLQLRWDAELSGSPGLTVVATSADGTVTELATVAARDGATITTSLDRRVQDAAEAALVNGNGLRGLVALRISTGEVLAAANGPRGTASDVALGARVPPGSTFKVVSTLAYLRRGLTPDQIVSCPAEANVGGRAFRNAGGFALGDVPFRTDFARSCNTAFVRLAEDMAPQELVDAASAFGLGAEWDIGAASGFTGSVPLPESVVDTAASSIGQGRLLMSPLAMAGVAATVARGEWSAPRLVLDPALPAGPDPIPLRPGEADTLRDLMRGVVTGGSGSALAGIPGGEVFAKTGTAEFGSEDPPLTHAWIIGFQGDIAFSVFVELGESGGSVAGPIAADFLSRLAAG